MTVLRVTCDTNIFISALNFSGNPQRVVNLAERGKIRLAISDEIAKEIDRVLRREKFGWPSAEIDRALKAISYFTEHVQPQQRIDAITEDETDNRILECATASGSDYIVSGDKHLLKLGQYQRVKIVTPADFLEILAQAAQSS